MLADDRPADIRGITGSATGSVHPWRDPWHAREVISEGDDLIDRGRAALAACDWEGACAWFEQAVASIGSAAALDGLGQAHYWLGEYDRAFSLREQAYAAYRRQGDMRCAGAVAVELGALHLWVHGNEAACDGWIGLAWRMLEGQDEGVEHGWLELLLASMADDAAEHEARARTALDTGRRFDDVGLEYDALGHVGLSLVRRGQVADGMRLIDEAAAAVSSGVVTDPWSAGEIYCSLFGACELAIDVRRAEAWLAAIDGYVERTGELPVSAICRTHYGGILRFAGRWRDAEVELTEAIELYDRTWRGSRFGPVLRLADLRVLQGRLDDARELLRGYEDSPEAAVPLARLQLVEGTPAVAVRTIERCLARRGRGLASAPLLAFLVEAYLLAGRQADAQTVSRELDALGGSTGQQAVRGLAALARARVAIATGSRSVIDLLEEALAAFVEAELPYEVAVTRHALAEALGEDQPELARDEGRTALAIFERLRADPDVVARSAVLRRLGASEAGVPGAASSLTPRETEVLGLLADGCSNAQIADHLYISIRTAEDHVSSILTKLGVSNRTQAAAHAHRGGADHHAT
jgi:DNA-binding NarL/FixJ family response regulator/tetratricopeptide (TPR) repeat protein